jgi:hypothetical protein
MFAPNVRNKKAYSSLKTLVKQPDRICNPRKAVKTLLCASYGKRRGPVKNKTGAPASPLRYSFRNHDSSIPKTTEETVTINDIDEPDRYPSDRRATSGETQTPAIEHSFAIIFYPLAASTVCATRSIVASSKCLPITCTPIGNPVLVSPQGTDTPQIPARLAATE